MRTIIFHIIVFCILVISPGCRDLVIGGTPVDAGDAASTDDIDTSSNDNEVISFEAGASVLLEAVTSLQVALK
jgi:hypothetical protein